MYSMKKVIVVAGAFLFTGIASVQAQTAGVFFKAGLNLSNVSINKDGEVNDANTLVGFHAGFQGDLPITSFFAIQPGLFLTGKGSKLVSGDESGSNWYRATTRPYYLEVPVNAVVKLPLSDEASFFFGAGPYAAIGLFGKNTVEGEVLGVGFKRTDNIEFSNDDPFTSQEEGSGYGILRRFDYGLNGTIGLQGKRAMVSVNYGLGLAKLQSGATNSADELNKHRVLSFTLGFRL